jgi:hypothetical protein
MELKQRYEAYDSGKMDLITNEVLQGKRQITREDVWKAVDYDRVVSSQREIAEKAYQLGRLDAQGKNQDKVESMAFGSSNTSAISSTDVPEKAAGESALAYIKRLGMRNIQRVANK